MYMKHAHGAITQKFTCCRKKPTGVKSQKAYAPVSLPCTDTCTNTNSNFNTEHERAWAPRSDVYADCLDLMTIPDAFR